jgi:hypothetical protein
MEGMSIWVKEHHLSANVWGMLFILSVDAAAEGHTISRKNVALPADMVYHQRSGATNGRVENYLARDSL